MNNTEELEFAYQIRRALDQRNTALPTATLDRLALARKTALAHKKTAPAIVSALATNMTAGRNSFWSTPSLLTRFGAVAPLLAGLVLFIGLYQYEQQRHIDQIADLDTAVLSDELPLSAYADHGFNAFLAKRPGD